MSRAERIEEQASLWVLRREELHWSDTDQGSLDDWLAESDAHKVAFWRLQHGWREADRIGSLGVPLRPASRVFAGLPAWQPIALAASVLLAVAVFLTQWQGLPLSTGASEDAASGRFETPIGGHEVVTLADGSRVELNTGTLVRAAVTDKARAVWLDRGEAFFSITKRAGEKFVIYAGPRTITVLGTKFSVRRAGDETVVAVLEGRVRLQTASLGREALVTGGELAVARDQGTLVAKSAVAVQHELAWRTGMIDLDGMNLAAAAAQFNRYNRKQLVVADANAARTLIEGSFVARNVDGFARLLEDAYGLQAVESAGRILVSTRRMADRGSLKSFNTVPTPSRPATSLQSALGQVPVPAPATQLAMLPDKQAIRDANNWDVIHKLYPPRALAAGEEGLVGFVVEMDATGSPTKCKITHTSGHPLLDLETCQLIMEHATFSRPTGLSPSQKRSYEGVVNWRLPNTPATAVPALPKVIAQSSAPEPLVCKRIQKTGSLAGFDRKCMSKSDWDRASEETRESWTRPPGTGLNVCEGPQCK